MGSGLVRVPTFKPYSSSILFFLLPLVIMNWKAGGGGILFSGLNGVTVIGVVGVVTCGLNICRCRVRSPNKLACCCADFCFKSKAPTGFKPPKNLFSKTLTASTACIVLSVVSALNLCSLRVSNNVLTNCSVLSLLSFSVFIICPAPPVIPKLVAIVCVAGRAGAGSEAVSAPFCVAIVCVAGRAGAGSEAVSAPF